MITFREIKSGPAAFLGFLSLKAYLTNETTQDKKRRARRLLVRVMARRRAGMFIRPVFGIGAIIKPN